jgi:hypothetical protein
MYALQFPRFQTQLLAQFWSRNAKKSKHSVNVSTACILPVTYLPVLSEYPKTRSTATLRTTLQFVFLEILYYNLSFKFVLSKNYAKFTFCYFNPAEEQPDVKLFSLDI